ncbi:hypothetical protein GWI33_016594 [Rhynchophorus ferrugineus]|uniref:m7GpppN-mRNA hydrolase n=1 Tax=Rhynchophorus ferrugineus TaxID=354439 RepID=A0A834HYE3_RHYFE|nr:hypothetical protein GWI33_016594 [Rhynchophorus ferrugineus]
MAEELQTTEHSIPIDILNDLLTRFIIFVPQSAKQNLIRICFQIELAHWFYLDFYVGNDPRLKSCTIYEFAAHVFQHVPFLKSERYKLNQILAEWREYKQTVPTYGAIILSEELTHVLLVQSYWAKASWGFPKGKVNEDEDPAHCAIREVLEETGFDISPYIKPNEYLESVIHEQFVRLYIIKNIPRSTEFTPRTRCEIKACSWFAVADLPNNKKDATPKSKMGVSPNAFFMVLPFIKRVKAICSGGTLGRRGRNKSLSLSEGESSTCKGKKGKLDSDNKKKQQQQENRKHSKRQLFTDDERPIVEFSAPSWLNFKFDKTAIMECMP